MKRILANGRYLLLMAWLGGCSTLTGDFHQSLQIDALDAQNHPVSGMHCQVGTGTSAKTVVTPATNVRVRRALQPLEIECRRDGQVATATVKSRRERMEEALLPFGSVGVFVDHLSGSLYSYPTALHLRVGQHLVLEHGGEAQVAQAEPISAARHPESTSTSEPQDALSSGWTAPVAATPSAQPAAASSQAAQVAIAPRVATTASAQSAAGARSKAPAAPTTGVGLTMSAQSAKGARPKAATAPAAKVGAIASAQPAAGQAQKAQAASASKSNRTTAKAGKTTSTAVATTKSRTNVAATAAAKGTTAGAVTGIAARAGAVAAAPVNW